MNRDPKQHPFTPKEPESSACIWCPFHKDAHLDGDKQIDWVCVRCHTVLDPEHDKYCQGCSHAYFKPIKKD